MAKNQNPYKPVTWKELNDKLCCIEQTDIYVETFNATTDWSDSIVPGSLCFQVLGTVHKQGTGIIVEIQADGTTTWDATLTSYTVNKTTGDVTVCVPAFPDGRFAGRVLIMG